MEFATSLPLAPSLVCLILVCAFLWPAWRLLFVAGYQKEQPAYQRLAMAFVFAFGAFSLLTGPLLLAHAATQTACMTVGLVWIAAAVGAEFWARKKRAPSCMQTKQAEAFTTAEPSFQNFRGLLPALLFSLGASTSLALALIPSSAALALIGFSFATNVYLIRRAEKIGAPTRPQSHPWIGLLLCALVVSAVVTPALHHRADADDNLYLSESLLLQDTPAMGQFAPTHRGEALPANSVYAWQAFELWGAMLARISGLHTLIVLRSLVGPLLLLLSLALYTSLLRLFIPKGLLPVALVCLLAYFLFGVSSHWTPNNYLLTRPQQGKTWLMHAGVLALLLQSLQFLRTPSKANWALLSLISLACLGWAPTAILLVPAVLGTLSLVQFCRSPTRESLKHGLLLFLAAAPQILFVIFLRLQNDHGLQEATLGYESDSSWPDLFFFIYLKIRTGGGALDIFALLSAPLLWLLFPQSKKQIFPLLFLGGLAIVLLNPLLYGIIEEITSGKWGYLRLFWLLPVPFLFAALGSALYASFLQQKNGNTKSFLALGSFLCAMPLCGAHYIWSTENLYAPADSGTVMFEVENPYKIPGGLLDLAAHLTHLPLGPEHRILCHLNEVTHLAPLVQEFDFVFARDFQTPPPLIALGREQEALRREKLSLEFLHGTMADAEAATLLQSELADYVVVSPYTADLSAQLSSLHYSLRFGSGPYELWVRD